MTVGNAVIEAACASLVREYLNKKGFKGTLEKMDEECPRNELSISNRQALIKHVNLQKLMTRNKEEKQPLEAMLEIMTKHFMENVPYCSVQHLKESESSPGPVNGFKPDISFGLKANELVHPHPVKNMRQDATTLATKRERGQTYHDLVMDEDVEGETVIGNGKDSIMSMESAQSPLHYATKTPSSRPVSAKHGGGTIFSNDSVIAQKGRSHKVKSSRAPAHQQDQQIKDIGLPADSIYNSSVSQNCNRVANSDTIHNSKFSMEILGANNSYVNKPNKVVKKPSGSSPVSFEALLIKGEEKANLLHRKVLDPKNDIKSEQYKAETSSMMNERKLRQCKHDREFDLQNSVPMLDLDFGEVEDVDIGGLELKSVSPVLQKSLKPPTAQSTPVDLKTAIMLKNIVLGSPNQQYSDEWRLQSYSFCDIPNIKYGLVQKKSGPCGVLAAVQACLLQEMLFGVNKLHEARFKNVSRGDRSKALALALSNIFWRAGDYSRAVVTVLSQSTHILNSTKFKQDYVTERLNIYTFTNFSELSSFLLQSVSQFETDGSPGVILTLYSAILSRKPHLVRGDFDVSEQTTFIGFHGYCTQELVNLLLTGRAVSNVFNDIVQLDSGGSSQAVILKGICSRSEIGFLSLFEHYKTCQAGSYYKTPKNPIWVVCSESHFTVLFSTCKDLINDWKMERRFDLFYYDGLAKQQEEIKLTVSTINQSYKPASDEDLVPPLEHCIRTKWADAEIDWNGLEPIL
ncbi:unnamed protein product [Candidula unifasciata]|uniref:Ubiquitin carboxyl-terminal hydrolase MINDY n=1 Tax=Candidula unifasciata TaxID=100452 RepID=A0A8S3ZYW1_9EUPU|nr:unnamed protein product [Candidula unifasciata]